MTEEQLTAKLLDEESKYESVRRALYREYALSNAKYKVGDIIKDQSHTILVASVKAYKGLGLPEAIYDGPILLKSGDKKLDKKGKEIIHRVYQSNIV